MLNADIQIIAAMQLNEKELKLASFSSHLTIRYPLENAVSFKVRMRQSLYYYKFKYSLTKQSPMMQLKKNC